MRRKSSRNLAKPSPEKVQQSETPVRKSRRTIKRRRRSSSSDTGNSEEEQEVKTIEHVFTEEENLKIDTSITDDTDKVEETHFKFTALCDSTSSPKRQSKDRQRKAGNTQEEKLPNQEVVPTRRSRRRGSPKVEESTRQEEEEDKKGKGKSKGKNKSKIEKIHPLNESEAHNEREISENVQVTPESPQTNTDNPVDNEHMTVIESVENSEDGTKGESVSVQDEEEMRKNKEKTRSHHSLSKDKNNSSNNKSKSRTPLKLDKNLGASDNSSDQQNQCNKNTNQSPDQETDKNILTENVDQECIGAWEEKDENAQDTQTSEINETIQEEIVVSTTEEVKYSGENDQVIEVVQSEIIIEYVKDDEVIIQEVNMDVQVQEEQEDVGNKIESEREGPEYGKQSLEIMKEVEQETEKAEQEIEKEEEEIEKVEQEIEKEEQEIEKEEQEIEKEEQEIEKEEQEIEKEEQEIEKEEQEIEAEQVSEKDQESMKEEPEIEKEQQIVKEDEVHGKNLQKDISDSVFTTEERVIKNQPANKIGTKTKSHKKKVEISRNFDDESRQTIIHRKKWGSSPVGLDLISPHLIPVDIDVFKSFCQNFRFLEETEVTLEHAETKDRRRSLAEREREKKTERKVSLDDIVRPTYGSQLSDNSIKSEDNLEAELDNSNIIAMNRKISIVDDSASKLKPPPSPARNPVSQVLYITNLVRPFTLKQLKELLERTGKIIDNGFWTDRIKSKCYVQYETAEEAEATRNALHGVHWPIGNGKKLIIDFATSTDLENSRNPPPPPPPPAPLVPEVNKNEKENKEEQKKVKQEEEHIIKERDREREKERHRSEHVREWDVGKENLHRRHSRSHERHEKRRHSHRSPSPIDDFIARKHKKMEEQLPQKLMDDLFQKTKATPSIYWQPLTPEEIATKQQQRLERMAEHKRRMEETSRSRADYGRGGPYRRRYD